MQQINNIKIIYPETPELEKIALELKKEINGYRIPNSVKQKTGIPSVDQVKEPWLIVLCTPKTPSDSGICEQINKMTEQGLYRHILTLLVSGTPDQSFPDSLLHEYLPDGTIIDHEPLAANISSETEKESLAKIKVEKLRLIAPILGVSFDDLMNRRLRQRRRILAIIGAAVLVGAAAFLIVMIYRVNKFSQQNEELNIQYEKAEAARKNAEESLNAAEKSYAATVGVDASEVLATGDTERAMRMCLEYLPQMSDVPELTDTLKKALEIRCGSGYIPLTVYEEELPVEQNFFDHGSGFFNQDTGSYVGNLEESYEISDYRLDFSSDGNIIKVLGDEEVYVYDPVNNIEKGHFTSPDFPVDNNTDIVFAGERDSENGRCSSDSVICAGIRFIFQKDEINVPDDLEGQITLGWELLGK